MSTKLKVGDRVRGNDSITIEKAKGCTGTVIFFYDDELDVLVEFDKNIDGHDGGYNRGKKGHCWYVTSEMVELIKEEPIKEELTTPTINVNVTVNIYDNACWYCRKGGLVDLYLAGHPGICPSCGRWCNVATPLPSNAMSKDITSIEERVRKLREDVFRDFEVEIPF